MEQINLVKNIKDFMGVQKALQDIEKIVNNLIKSTNTSSEGDVSDLEGKTGDIRITQNEDKDYIFEVRTEEGWKTPVIGNSAIKFKDKPSDTAKNQKKSIDEIEAEDNSSGDSIANLTTFDEKSNKFVLARPDYNSGWIWYDWSEHNWSGSHPAWKFAHTLESLPTLVSIQVAPALTGNPTSGTDENLISDQSTITWYTEMNNHFGDSYGNNQVYGLTYKVDKDYVYVDGAESQAGWISDYDDADTSAVSFQDCSIRILLWK